MKNFFKLFGVIVLATVIGFGVVACGGGGGGNPGYPGTPVDPGMPVDPGTGTPSTPVDPGNPSTPVDPNNPIVTEIPVPGKSLSEKLQWLIHNAENDGSYFIELSAVYESIDSQTLSYTGRSNILIRLKGIGNNPRVVECKINGALFTIGNSVTLILDDNIILSVGSRTSIHPMIQVQGRLIMNNGVKITENSNIKSQLGIPGGGVYVSSGGIFTMEGGEISGNTVAPISAGDGSHGGGGVFVDNEGIFIMNGGTIYDNIVSDVNNPGGVIGHGGGVYVRGGTFTMNGGGILDNTTTTSSSSYLPYGGGVHVSGGTFTMNGGEILGNTNSSEPISRIKQSQTIFVSGGGGGVSMSSGIFNMSGGKISGNIFSSSTFISTYRLSLYLGGGGVYISGGTFNMSGGEISGNIVSYIGNQLTISPYCYPNHFRGGGGVYISDGTFYMSGGEISGNTVTTTYSSDFGSLDEDYYIIGGGGVYVCYRGIFIKYNGTIYGYNTNDTVNSNVVKYYDTVRNDGGHALLANNYNLNNPNNPNIITKRKEATAGTGINLTFNSRDGSFSGEWDY